MRKIFAVTAPLVLLACGEQAEETPTEPIDGGTRVVMVEAGEGPDGLLPDATGEDAWRVDPGASRVMFTGRQGDDSFTGRFGTFDAAINLDPSDPSDGLIVAAVDLGSVDAGTADRNDSLPEADWFDIARHPRATFRSSVIRTSEPGLYEADGVLTLKGMERPVTLPFTLVIEGDRAVADGTFSLDRGDFGVGQGEFASADWVDTEVGVSLHIEAVRAP